MDGIRTWIERLYGVVFRRRVEREVEEEMRYHLEMETREKIARGMDPVEARRTTRAEFGSVDAWRTQARQERWGWRWDVLVHDTRYALRVLRKSPGLTGVILLTLALGIGANAAIFTMVDAALLRSLPYGETDRAVWIQTFWEGSPQASLSPAEYLDYRQRLTDVYASLGVYAFGSFNLTSHGDPERARTSFVSAEVFEALGVSPSRGRAFTDEEDTEGAPVVLLSDGFWRQRFAADPDVVGQSIRLSGRDREILGVLPPGFRLPEEILVGETSKLYAPMGIDQSQVNMRGSHFLSGVARLAPDVTFDQARLALEAVARGFWDEYPDDYKADMGFGATAVPLARQVRGPARSLLFILLGAVGSLLLVASANVANLLLARADRRAREFALRTAIGAGQGRIVTQVIVESAVLALVGGALGLVVGRLVLGAFTALVPLDLPWLTGLHLDPRAVAFTFALSAATGLAAGLAPALHAARSPDLVGSLKAGGSSADGHRGHRLRRALAVAEMALALILLAGAGLFLRSFAGLVQVDPGYRTERVLTARLSLPGAEYQENESVVGFYRSLMERVAEIPGIESAGAVTNLPLTTRLGDHSFIIEGRPIPEGSVKPDADWQTVTPGYFDAMGIAVLRGRVVETRDTAASEAVLVVNETFAKTHWPNENAVGKRLRFTATAFQPERAEVIGVVRDVRHADLHHNTRPQMYFAHEQFRFWGSGNAVPRMTLVVSSPLPPEELRGAVTAAVRSLDADLPVADVRTMEDVRRASEALPRFLMTVIGAFSIVALLLAALGIYGVMAQMVGRRIPEFGVRMALGARPAEVTGLVVRQGARLALTGIALGVAGAVVVTRALGSQLYEVSPTDPGILAAVSLLLGLTALAACFVPARRATRADPAKLLRAE